MPRCIVCNAETPVTAFLLLREYKETQGRYWYFCSPDHLFEWLDNQERISRFGIKGEKIIIWDWEKR